MFARPRQRGSRHFREREPMRRRGPWNRGRWMLAEQIAVAVAGARTSACLDNLARLTWRGLAEGHIAEADAEALSAAVEAGRQRLGSRTTRVIPKAATAPRRPVSPDRRKSLERRRRVAMSGAVPGAIALSFTMGELAVLSIVAREIQRRGRCELPVDAIAALAGVGRTVTQGALRRARQLGLLSIVERRHRGRASDTNVISVTSREWATWLRIGGRVRKDERHVIQEEKKPCGQWGQATGGVAFSVRSRHTDAGLLEDGLHDVQHHDGEPRG